MPTSLFKFCQISEYTRDNIRDCTLLFKDPRKYNDPFEMHFTIVDKSHYSSPDIGRDLSLRQAENNNQLADFYHAYCLCESEPDDEKSLLMWAYYADEHRGLAIEYDYNVLTSDFQLPPIKVTYESIVPNLKDANDKNQPVKIASTKSIHWNHENEHRFLIPDCMSNNFPGKNIAEGRLFYHDPSAIKGIYFGLKANTESPISLEIRAEAARRKIPVFNMNKNIIHYKLFFKRL